MEISCSLWRQTNNAYVGCAPTTFGLCAHQNDDPIIVVILMMVSCAMPVSKHLTRTLTYIHEDLHVKIPSAQVRCVKKCLLVLIIFPDLASCCSCISARGMCLITEYNRDDFSWPTESCLQLYSLAVKEHFNTHSTYGIIVLFSCVITLKSHCLIITSAMF